MSHSASNIEPASIKCIGCGYDLSGTPIGGRCPECGEPVRDSVVAVERGVRTWPRRSRRAAPGLLIRVGFITACLLTGPFALALRNHARELHEQGLLDEVSLRFIEAAAILSNLVLGALFIAFVLAVLMASRAA